MITKFRNIGRSLLNLASSQLDWIDRKTEEKHRAALKDRYTLEACFVCCIFLFLLAWSAGTIVAVGRQICALALIIVALKIFQLLLLANHQPKGPWHE